MDELQEYAKDYLHNENTVNLIAELSNLGIAETKEILKTISEKPEVSKEAMDFIWSSHTSTDLKAFNAGFEKGIKTGYSDGFGKGAVTIGGVGLLMYGLKYLLDKKKK